MKNGKKLGLSVFCVVLVIVLVMLIIFTMLVNYSFGSFTKSGSLFGKNIFVMNSDIMEPEIENGTAVISDSEDISVLTEGSVILYRENEESENIMRIAEVVHNTDSTVYKVCGDNAPNKVTEVDKKKVIAKCQYTDRKLGDAITFFKSMKGIIIGMLIPCAVLIALLLLKIFSIKKRRRLEEEEIVYPETTFGISNSETRDPSQNPLFDPSMAPKVDADFVAKKNAIAEHFGVKPGAKKTPDGETGRDVHEESAVEKFKAAVEEKPPTAVTKKVSLAPDVGSDEKSEKMAAIKAALSKKENDEADDAEEESTVSPAAEDEIEELIEETVSEDRKPAKRTHNKENDIKSIDDLIKALEEEKNKL